MPDLAELHHQASLFFWLRIARFEAMAAGKSIIATFTAPASEAPAAIGPYSQAAAIGNTVYVSGCIGLLPGAGKQFASEDVVGQAKQALANMKAILEASGSSMNNVAKTTVLLTDMANYGAVSGASCHIPCLQRQRYFCCR